MCSVQNSKSSLSLTNEILFRSLFSSFVIVLFVAIITLIRALSMGIDNPFKSDDWILVSAFLILWNVIPAILANILTRKTKIGNFFSYLVFVVLEIFLFYLYVYNVSNKSGNELASSPLILMVYLAIPIALAFYPIYFFNRTIFFLRK